MIELKKDGLKFSFPEVHKDAQLGIDFQRTLRIPDDGNSYALPPGLGRFPLQHVDDFANDVSGRWLTHGGVMMPMYQSEAMWLNFSARGHDFPYPFAVKIATGKINAVTGEGWENGLRSTPQDYLVCPLQPWLDGYCVEKGVIRQFVATPLGSGYTAEEQVTGEAEVGGLQVTAYPMRREAYEVRRRKWLAERSLPTAIPDGVCFSMMEEGTASDMGLAPGGRMRQEIYDDPYGLDEWDTECASRCFVHIANSLVWRSITGQNPPTTPPTAREYTKAGLPWFEFYSDAEAIDGSAILSGLESVSAIGRTRGGVPLPENESVSPDNVVHLRTGLLPGQVREPRASVTQ